MKITLRLILSLLVTATLVATLFSYLQVCDEQQRLTNELERQAIILGESLQESVKDLVQADSPTKLKRMVERFGDLEELVGVAVYNDKQVLLGFTQIHNYPALSLETTESILVTEAILESINSNKAFSKLENIAGQETYLYIAPLKKSQNLVGFLVLFYNALELSQQTIDDKQITSPKEAERFIKEKERFIKELERQARLLSEGLRSPIKELFWSDSPSKLKHIVERFGNRERLIGVAVYDNQRVILASTPGLLSQIPHLTSQFTQSAIVTESVTESTKDNKGVASFEYIEGKDVHLYVTPLKREDNILGTLVLFHDASYISKRLQQIWFNNFIRLLALSLFITITTVLVVRWSVTGPIAQMATWLKQVRLGKAEQLENLPRGDFLNPLTTEVAHLAKALATARTVGESQVQITSEAIWTPRRLKEYMHIELNNKKLYIVSNREPYIHEKEGEKINCIIPAGGLITALDPVLRACGGVWVAHGSGKADRETANKEGRLQVPPEEPLYTLKRVWLTKEEEEGYYYGFANEGIWPLCHITHTRPIFRLEDWAYYRQVNEKFAVSLLEELSKEESPLILIQDYHFALLPFLIKLKRPDARIAIFWHIPWPNSEIFSICPWKEELLTGLLGADLIGFHTQFHCNNFLETIDRILECKINWDQFSIERSGYLTLVKPFPISVTFSEINEPSNIELNLETVTREIGIKPSFLGVGVDRLDYTKGIVERFLAIERFLEKHPEFIGQFTFVELGAPSRTHIKRYHDLIAEIEETVGKINWRFQTEGWKPIIFLKAHHSHDKIKCYYKVADICMVTSLHDGMNLVAKEFIAACTNNEGVLVLSQFTGAAQELTDALIVNPYDIEEMADAIYVALVMESEEKTKRMQRLREIVRERNVYRWASDLITELSRLRVPTKKNSDRKGEKTAGSTAIN